MLKLVLPKGSLEKATMELFEAADLGVQRSSEVAYKANISDPRIDSVRILRPQEIPTYVADGLFDLGITGRDWVEETGSDVVSLGELRYSKATSKPIKVVLAVPDDSPYQSAADLPAGVRVSTEYMGLTRRYFESKGVDADIRLSYGATEAKVPDIVDCIIEITETGRALRAAGLRIIDEVLISYTELVANRAAYEDPEKRHAMEQILTLLLGVMEARGKVLVKLNISAEQLDVRDRGPAGHEDPDGQRALRRGGLRGRDGRAEERDQRAHPGAEGRRRHRHHRTAAVEDRALRPVARAPEHIGVVTAFDEAVGLGTVRAEDGTRAPVPLHRHRGRHPGHPRRCQGPLRRGAGSPRTLGSDRARPDRLSLPTARLIRRRASRPRWPA